MKSLRSALWIILFAAASLGTAGAQQPTPAQQDAIRQSCRGDFQSLCTGVSPGGSAALQCLQTNAARLSPGCRTAVGALQGGASTAPAAAAPPAGAPPATHPPMRPRDEAFLIREACGGDFRAHCPGVRLGGGRAIACLADHRESLSPRCQQALAEAR